MSNPILALLSPFILLAIGILGGRFVYYWSHRK